LNDASLDDLLVDDLVNAASRSIEAYCGRQFYPDTSATARTYSASSYTCVYTDDFWDAATAIVKTDSGQDGTYETTLTVSTQYILEPVNGVVDGISGYPYNRIRLMAGGLFATPTYGRPQVQVTAKWGWAAVPYPVKQACRQLIGEMWKRKDAGPYGTIGSQEFGSMILSSDQMRPTAALLAPYGTGASAGVGALA
jgi:hypothetical protein